MGYHRAESMINDTPDLRELKVSTFWFVYVLDKGLCLRLGRAAKIQDYDISVAVPEPAPVDRHDHTSRQIIRWWIKLAAIQGRIYEDLYSSRALRQIDGSITAKADILASEIRVLQAEHDEIGRIPGASIEVHELFLLADEIVLCTTLTLILGAAMRAEGYSLSRNHQRAATARRALELHQTCCLQYRAMVGQEIFVDYVHWTLLHTPFIPICVIFSNVVKDRSLDDLRLLGDFKDKLQPVRAASSAIEKMFLLCDTFYRVAKLLMRSTREAPSYSTVTQTEIPAELQREVDSFIGRAGYLSSGFEELNSYVTGSNADHSDPPLYLDPFLPEMEDWFPTGDDATFLDAFTKTPGGLDAENGA